MKFLITGSTGQLGKEWTRYLQKESIESNFAAYGSKDLDITNYNQVKERLEAQNPDVVINCAAYTNVDLAEDEPERAEAINAEAVANLANCCREHAIKLVHYSTDYVFPGYPSDRKLFPNGYPADQQAEPINQYGTSKHHGEIAVRKHCDDYLLLRVAWLCGVYGQNFVTKMLQLSKQHDTLKVVNDQWGSPTFTSNVVDNTVALLESGRRGTYHINCDGVITWYELAQKVFAYTQTEITLKPVSSTEFASNASRPAFSKLDTQKLQGVEGSRIIAWSDGLRQMLKSLNEN